VRVAVENFVGTNLKPVVMGLKKRVSGTRRMRRRHSWPNARGVAARRRLTEMLFKGRTTRFEAPSPMADFRPASDADRIRTAVKWAQDVLWEWGPETGGASDDRTLAALCLIFCDPELVAASEALQHPLGAAVRDIRAILARKERDPLLPSRQIINALWQESALDAPWLYAAFARPNDRLVFERARRERSHRDDAG
jgi:hypothetical protein